MKTMSLADFRKTLIAQGVPVKHFAFRCPMCNTVQSARDLIDAEAGGDFEGVEQYLGFTCVGRFTGAGTPSVEKDQGHGCNWTLGGLLQTHTLEVIAEDGTRHPRFEPVSAEEAQAHMSRKCSYELLPLKPAQDSRQEAGQKSMSELIRQHRIAVTPEHEGQWHADLYADEAEPLARAEGDTPDDAVAAVVALYLSLKEQQP